VTPASTDLSVIGRRSLVSVLELGESQFPEKTLLVYEDHDGISHRYSWSEFGDESRRMALRLRERGVVAGDRVHVHLENGPLFYFVWFACAYLGAAMVPTGMQATKNELTYVIDHSRALLSVTDSRWTDLFNDIRGGGGDHVLLSDVLTANPKGNLEPVENLVGRDAAVLYTSGTTALPKGVRVTQGNYVYAGEVLSQAIRAEPSDRFIVALPLFHANAQYYSSMGALVAGARIVLLRGFSASRYLSQACKYEATVGSLFAAPIRMILRQSAVMAASDLRLRLMLFAQNLRPEELAAWDSLTGVPLLQLYGMTETIGPPLINQLGDSRANALGRVSLGYSCKVVDDSGSAVFVGQPGELFVRGTPGTSIMAGYLHDETSTNAAVADGWLRTGDLVREDGDGFVYFVDRVKDVVKRGGENVGASEVEAILRQHPAVDEAAVVAMPDDMMNEAVVAFVTCIPSLGLRLTGDEIQDWCKGRLAKFRVPSAVIVIDNLPRTSVGKIEKRTLKAALARRWDSASARLIDDP
jgi:crotonobetaine/carnitine-CoA ligase